MVQQINLYDASLRPSRERWRAAHGLWLAGGTLAVALALSAALDAWSSRRLAQAGQIEQQLAAERQLHERNGGGADANRARVAELERLRALDAGQRRVHALLDSQAAGRKDGYSPYFLALSRQAHEALWITGFGVGGDGEALEIQGRMVDAAVLPDYLRKLTREPQFKGRSFAQLSLHAATAQGDATAAAGYTEFVLRSSAPAGATAEAGRP